MDDSHAATAVRQDFPCPEEKKITMNDKLTVRREKPFNYRLRQQIPTEGSLTRQKGYRHSFVLLHEFGLNMESITWLRYSYTNSLSNAITSSNWKTRLTTGYYFSIIIQEWCTCTMNHCTWCSCTMKIGSLLFFCYSHSNLTQRLFLIKRSFS